MTRENRSKLFKICCIASVLALMLSLCGCRTRLTNNDEVLSVVYDDDVFLQDEYQMRRDALGLDKAKKPFFTGFDSTEEEDDYFEDPDVSRLEDYNPDERELYEDDPDLFGENGGSKKKKAAGGGSSLGKADEEDGDSEPEPQEIVVTLDPNGGKCEEDTIVVVIGETYGKLPEATREGYDFLGWYTTKGKKVGSETVVRATKDHSLFAQWKEKNKPSFTVTFDPNAEELDVITINVPEGDSYGTLPEVPREGYDFLGWFSAPTGGDKIKADVPVTSDQTWYAHWDGFKFWDNTVSAAIVEIAAMTDERKISFATDTEDDNLLKLATDCVGRKVDTDAEDIVFFEDDMSKENAETLANDNPGVQVIVISKKIAGDTSDKNKKKNLYLKLLLINKLYGLDISSAKAELEITDNDEDYIRMPDIVKAEMPPGEEPEPEPDDTPPGSESQSQPGTEG